MLCILWKNRKNLITKIQIFIFLLIQILVQLWRVNGTTLTNRGNIWKSNDQWNFGNKTDLIHIIENTSKSKVLGTTSTGEVIEEDFDGNRTEQLWVKGEPNNEGYFTVTTSESKLLFSANSSETLEVKGISNCSMEVQVLYTLH